MRYGWLHIALLFLLVPIVAQSGDALPLVDPETLHPSDPGPIRIEVAGISGGDFSARYLNDTLFLPYVLFCDFLRVKSSVSDDRRTLTGEIPGVDTFHIDRGDGIARTRAGNVPLPPDAIRVVAGEVFVEQSFLISILGVIANYDAEMLKLTVAADPKLPVVRLARNSSRYGALSRREEGRPRPGAPIVRRLVGAPVLNWNISSSFNPGERAFYGGSLRLGQELLFGTLDLGISGGVHSHDSAATRASVDMASWRYQVPGSDLLSQLTIGTLAIAGRTMTGASITNAPLTPREGLGIYTLQGSTRPGWMVELYDGNQLIDVTTADEAGSYRFDILLGYGTVDRTTREVGPHGEILFRSHRLQINQQMLPEGALEYTASLGVDTLGLAHTTAGAGRLAYGATTFLTFGLDAIYHAPRLDRPSTDSIATVASASAWLGGGNSLGARYAFDSRLAAAELYSITPSNVTLRLGIDSLRIDEGRYVASIGGALPFDGLTLAATTRYAQRETGTSLELEPQVSGYALGVNVIAASKYARSLDRESRDVADVPNDVSFLSSLRLMTSPFAGWLTSAEWKFDHVRGGTESVDLSCYVRLADQIGLDLSYSMPQLDPGRAMLQANLSIDLGALRLSAIGYRHGELVGSSIFASGSAVVSSHGVTTFNDPAVGEAVIIMESFLDRNGDGVRGDGEETLDPPAASLRIGRSELTTDDGIFHALPANRSVEIEIDRWAHAGRYLFPSRSRFQVHTLPSGAHMLEIPFSEGYDISGICRIEGASITLLNGLRLQLVSNETGASFEGEVFSDGTIFIAGVCSGSYTVVFDKDQLSSRRLKEVPHGSAIVIDEKHQRLPALRVRGENAPIGPR